MRKPLFKRNNKKNVAYVLGGLTDEICIDGYVSIDQIPEVKTASRRIAELIGSMTIHLMDSTEKGDYRIKNELSRAIDINPTKHMIRSHWMEAIVETMLLYGRGNAIVIPHTNRGYLGDLEPIAASRVNFIPVEWNDYKVLIDSTEFAPENVLHFVYNPDKTYLWKGQGIQVSLRDVIDNLRQGRTTAKEFMRSKWKPSVIIKVDAMTDVFQDPKKREKLLDEYIAMDGAGRPWIIPNEQIQIDTIKPLTLQDLAIDSTMELDKRAVAAFFGMPPFLLGVGEYDKDAWSNWISSWVKIIAQEIEQELTKKLIMKPEWYWKFNILSLMDWDIKTIADVFGGLSDKGFITGNEVRDRIGMSPLDGLDELRILENYIPMGMIGQQGKLIQDGGGDDA